ncbi:serine/threonine protein kinase [Wenzhouxiangella sp. AB-CW3]|uniref:serine/threonine-protein kinase n=1 Tax=Wenzhouxiangella sp. AB-CW3 TaxID=2771012 RepID=UPI00168B6886|nr:serine/threonine-protein kinase [Wenzhouxiangella sp. AB-CW3]QOC23913.1 serine/threonine protein kinase [Wenzhouxiangella sp. AB-CW3]
MSTRRARPRLTPRRRRLVDRLLDDLLELGEAERRVRLSQLETGHPRIACWVSELVAASDQPGEFLNTLFDRAGQAVRDSQVAQELRLPRGTRLGPWRIVEDAGSGGMGTVYRAERADGVFEMHAAIKLIRVHRRGLDERLKLERELLARLDHRHIARLIDGGATQDDQAYLVMEWVEGNTLPQHLQSDVPSLDARLDLFEQIADAVAHAHQRRVVHGDLKPGNVMVTSSGQARLVDFGVGRLLVDGGVKSEHAVRGLTPAYSAPEQRAGEEASTQSDVWALGRILQWLIDSRTSGKSDRLTAISAATEGIARRSDLAAILERACAESPKDRYAGAVQLLDDVQRYRQRLPVKACPATRTYLATRFVQRHWLGVSFGAAASLLLCLATAGALWQAHQATEERDRAALEAARAFTAEQDSLRLANELQQVVEFKTSLFALVDSSNMGIHLREDILARYRQSSVSEDDHRQLELPEPDQLENMLRVVNFTDLARASLEDNIFSTALESIDVQFADQPLVRARLLQTVATSMRTVGLLEQALEPQKQALAIRREQLGEEHLDTLDSMDHMGLLYGRVGRRDDQRQFYQEALNGYRRLVGDEDARTLNAMSNLGANYNARGELEQAETYFRQALSGQLDALGPAHHQTLITTHGLGYMLSLQGRHEEALPYYEAALSGRRDLYGDEHPDTLTAMNNLGGLLIEMGRPDDALPYYQQALDGRRRLLGNEHRVTLQSINNMGHLLSRLDRLDEARPLILEVLERAQVILGEQHPNTLIYLNNAGRLQLQLGQASQSERLYRQAVEGARSALPKRHWHTASFLAGHAGALHELERFADAEDAWLEAHGIFKEALGDSHERTLSTASDLAELYRSWARKSPDSGYQQKSAEWQARAQDESGGP